MLPVLQVDLKVLDRRARSRRVQLAGTVVASNAREPLRLGLRRQRLLLEHEVGEEGAGIGVDDGVAHLAVKGILRVRAPQLSDARCEPGRRRWLFNGIVSSGAPTGQQDCWLLCSIKQKKA